MTASSALENHALAAASANALAASPGDYLTFVLGSERCAISILDDYLHMIKVFGRHFGAPVDIVVPYRFETELVSRP